MNYWLILVPLLSSFTGWLAIRLSIKLLFHPRQPKKLLGFTLQGVFPGQQKQIASQAGKFVATEFSPFAAIENKISDPKNFEQVKPLIETHIDDFLRNKLKEQMPMISMFIGDKTINSLKTIFLQEIEELFPQVMLQFGNNLKKELDLEKMVMEKISAISPEKLESFFYKNLVKEFKTACLFGAAIGLFIGLVQLAIILAISK